MAWWCRRWKHEPSRERGLVYLVGQGKDVDEAPKLVGRHGRVEAAEAALEAVRQSETLGERTQGSVFAPPRPRAPR